MTVDARLSEEQLLVLETATRIAQQTQPMATSDVGTQKAAESTWMRLDDTGFLSLLLSDQESSTQFGGRSVEAVLVAEALGFHLSPAPYMGRIVGGFALSISSDGFLDNSVDSSESDARPAIVLRSDLSDVAIVGRDRFGIAFDCYGAKSALLLVEREGEFGITSVSLDEEYFDTNDLSRFARYVVLDERTSEFSPTVTIRGERLERWRALFMSTISAELVGVMGGALATAISYAKARRQFERSIGSFQAVQHMASSAFVHLEAARASVLFAAWATENLPAEKGALAARTAKGFASRISRPVTEAMIQIHGGIGMTWDALPHAFLRRALLDRELLGSEFFHYRQMVNERFERQQWI
jgi:hypothetical protein